jgi:hypothetical protein
MKNVRILLAASLAAILLAGCAPQASPTGVPVSPLLAAGIQVADLLKSNDFAGLSAWVSPSGTLRFSPYAFVRTDGDRTFTKAQVAALAGDTASYDWGVFAGKGSPIQGDVTYYFERFVRDRDLSSPDAIGIDTDLGGGNTIDNLAEAYPGAHFVEFYFKGSAEYGGMDWSSLKLVFEENNGGFVLVGIVHDQWTP